jgi:REP element-mobilizing transposase RayT
MRRYPQHLRGFDYSGPYRYVIAYCFMPDHVQMLLAGERDDADLKRFTKCAQQYSGFYFRQRTRLYLWQRCGFERVLRND